MRGAKSPWRKYSTLPGKRPNAGYTRKQWRVIRDLPPDQPIRPRPLLDRLPRSEDEILEDLARQLEAKWARFPPEFR